MLTAICMKVVGWMIRQKEKGHTRMQMGLNIWENGSKTNKKDQAKKYGWMELNSKASL